MTRDEYSGILNELSLLRIAIRELAIIVAYLAAQFPATPAMQEMRDRAEKIGGKS